MWRWSLGVRSMNTLSERLKLVFLTIGYLRWCSLGQWVRRMKDTNWVSWQQMQQCYVRRYCLANEYVEWKTHTGFIDSRDVVMWGDDAHWTFELTTRCTRWLTEMYLRPAFLNLPQPFQPFHIYIEYIYSFFMSCYCLVTEIFKMQFQRKNM